MFGKDKSYSEADVDKALQQHNPFAFRQAAEEVYEAGGGTVWVGKKKRKSGSAERRGVVKLEDVQSDPDFLSTIRKKYKNGIYLLRIFDKNGKAHSDHHFLLGGMEAEKTAGKKKKKSGSKNDVISFKEMRKLMKLMQPKQPKENGAKDAISVSDTLSMQQAGFDRTLHRLLAGTPEYFDQRFVKPFQCDVATGQPPDELAYAIFSMVKYARNRMPNPPLLIADFLRAQTIADHMAALDRFFGAIPELSNLPQKQLEIRDILMQMLGGSQEAPAGDVGVEESTAVMDDDQVVGESKIQDASDTTATRGTRSTEAAEVEDRGDSAVDASKTPR
jgi:hypothetical protein